MRHLKNILCLGIALSTPLMGIASESQDLLKKQQMIMDLHTIQNTLHIHYAPAEWKSFFSGWDLNIEIQNAKEKILMTDNITNAQFRKIIADFFNSTKDYHVGVYFYSTERATLPFSVTGAEGSYFITSIDQDYLPSDIYSINKGDELIFFDDRPVQDVIDELKQTTWQASDMTDQAFAEIRLTDRRGSIGMSVPRGPITITIKHKGSKQLASYQIIWNYTPERMQHDFGFDEPPREPTREELLEKVFNNKMLLLPYFDLLGSNSNESKSNLNDPEAKSGPNQIGSRNGFLPKLGKIWWKTDSDNSFNAYLYETPEKKLVGYVRIPHFGGDEDEVKEFQEIIEYFEERSDALVIDQVNNPGGNVFYLYALASMLTEQPLQTPKHRIALSSDFVYDAVMMSDILEDMLEDDDYDLEGESLGGIPISRQTLRFMLEFYNFIISEWNEGYTITRPTYLLGVDSINPHPTVNYTKPILMLINHLDFSGGDFFPAILQDNKRIITLGTKTAGAGGVVRGTAFPNQEGIAFFHYTFSIAERLDGKVLENLGVTPDIEYSLTAKDLTKGYTGYMKAIQQTVDIMLNVDQLFKEEPIEEAGSKQSEDSSSD